MGKMGSICRFYCALPASIWGHCSQVLVLLAFGARTHTHTKGCDNGTFVLFLAASGYLGTSRYCKTRKHTKCQIDRVLPPTCTFFLPAPPGPLRGEREFSRHPVTASTSSFLNLGISSGITKRYVYPAFPGRDSRTISRRYLRGYAWHLRV